MNDSVAGKLKYGDTTSYGLANKGVGWTSPTTRTSSRRTSRPRSTTSPTRWPPEGPGPDGPAVSTSGVLPPLWITIGGSTPGRARPSRHEGPPGSLSRPRNRSASPWPPLCSSCGTSPSPTVRRSPTTRHDHGAAGADPRYRRGERRRQNDGDDVIADTAKPDAGTMVIDGARTEIRPRRRPRPSASAWSTSISCWSPDDRRREHRPRCRAAGSATSLNLRRHPRRFARCPRSSGSRSTRRAVVDPVGRSAAARRDAQSAVPRARLLILDEPTAVLTPQEVEEFFASCARLRSRAAP